MNGLDDTTVHDTPLAGTSADGSLRFENRYDDDGGGRPAHFPTARIWDTKAEETLADGTAWTSSRVTPQPDGEWLLALRHYNHDALFKIDPAKHTFHTLGERRPDESLTHLAAAIDRAHKASTDKANAYKGLRLAPDDSLRVELVAAEWSNSHWVHSPRVIEVATGRVLLDLWNTDWDCEPSFPRERCVNLGLRRYRSRITLRAMLDLASDSFTIDGLDPWPPSHGSLANIAPALEAASRLAMASPTPHGAHHGEAPRRVGPRQLVVALLILIGTLATIGVVSFVAIRLHPDPPQKLTPLPKMPDAQPPAPAAMFTPQPTDTPPAPPPSYSQQSPRSTSRGNAQ
jgi:hypothetical protein